jgi:hypothetical protein
MRNRKTTRATTKETGTKQRATVGEPKPKSGRPTRGGMRAHMANIRRTRRPPLLMAVHAAAVTFASLSTKYLDARDGYRAELYKFAAKCYEIAKGFEDNLDQYERFKRDPFWADSPEKPLDNMKTRAVLVFAMRAKARRFQSRVTKTAKVLDHLAEQNKPAKEIAELIKKGGGIEKMYAALSPNSNNKARIPDDLEVLDPNVVETAADEANDRDDWPDAHDDDDGEAEGESEEDKNQDRQEPAAKKGGEKGESISERLTPAQRRFAALFVETRDLVVDLSKIGKTPSEVLEMGRICIEAEIGFPATKGLRTVIATKLTRRPKSTS